MSNSFNTFRSYHKKSPDSLLTNHLIAFLLFFKTENHLFYNEEINENINEVYFTHQGKSLIKDHLEYTYKKLSKVSEEKAWEVIFETLSPVLTYQLNHTLFNMVECLIGTRALDESDAWQFSSGFISFFDRYLKLGNELSEEQKEFYSAFKNIKRILQYQFCSIEDIAKDELMDELKDKLLFVKSHVPDEYLGPTFGDVAFHVFKYLFEKADKNKSADLIDLAENVIYGIYKLYVTQESDFLSSSENEREKSEFMKVAIAEDYDMNGMVYVIYRAYQVLDEESKAQAFLKTIIDELGDDDKAIESLNKVIAGEPDHKRRRVDSPL